MILNIILVSERVRQGNRKGQRNRRSSIVTRKSTSPQNANERKTTAHIDDKSKLPVACVISPPPVKQIEKCVNKEQKLESKLETEDCRNNKDNVKPSCTLQFTEPNLAEASDKGSCNAGERSLVKTVPNDIQSIEKSDYTEKLTTKDTQSRTKNLSRSVSEKAHAMKENDSNTNSLNNIVSNASPEKGNKNAVTHINEDNTCIRSRKKQEISFCIRSRKKQEISFSAKINEAEDSIMTGKDCENNVDVKRKKEDSSLRLNNDVTDNKQTELDTKTCQHIKGTVQGNLKVRDFEEKNSNSVVTTKAVIEKQYEASEGVESKTWTASDASKHNTHIVEANKKSRLKAVKFSEGPVAVINSPVKQNVVPEVCDNTLKCIQRCTDTETKTSYVDTKEEEICTQSNLNLETKHGDVISCDNDKDLHSEKKQILTECKGSYDNRSFSECDSKSPSAEIDGDKAFSDSFIIDTQVELIGSKETSLAQFEEPIKKTGTDVLKSVLESKNDVKTVPPNFVKQCLHSESLFTQDDLYCSFNTSLDYIPVVDKNMASNKTDVNNLGNGDSGNATGSGDTKETIKEDSNKSDLGSIVSENDLDMNISESGIDTSMDLIAASNYERVVCSNESVIQEQGMDDSYIDLHIPYQSGQEVCFENTDNDRQVVTGNCKGIAFLGNVRKRAASTGVLGEFSSPKPDLSTGIKYDNADLQADMAAALEMGDSFSGTFSTQSSSKNVNPQKSKSPQTDVNKGDMGDSLTLSMMEKVLEDGDDLKLIENDNDSHSKPGCDKYNSFPFTGVLDNLNDTTNKVKSVISSDNSSQGNCNIVNNVDTRKNVSFKKPDLSLSTLSILDNMCDSFLTPKCRSAPKRAKATPGSRTPKSQKTHSVDYSTPDALNLDKKRTRAKQISNERKRNNEFTNNDCSNEPKMLKQSNNLVSDGYCNDENKRDSLQNTSTESDYVPPTPPDEGQSCSSPLRQSKNVTTSLRVMSPFSPKLRSSKNIQSSPNSRLDKRESRSQAHQSKTKLTVACAENKTVCKALNCESDLERKSVSTVSKNSEVNGEDIDMYIEHDRVEEDIDEDNDKLPASFLDLNESGIPLTQSSFTIIDVCADKRLFKTFIMEWRTKNRYAVALACEKRLETRAPGSGIGGKFQKSKGRFHSELHIRKDFSYN